MDQLNLNLILGREDNEQKLINCLNNFEENKKNVLTKRGMYIYGSPGTGKTLFVEKILKTKIVVHLFYGFSYYHEHQF